MLKIDRVMQLIMLILLFPLVQGCSRDLAQPTTPGEASPSASVASEEDVSRVFFTTEEDEWLQKWGDESLSVTVVEEVSELESLIQFGEIDILYVHPNGMEIVDKELYRDVLAQNTVVAIFDRTIQEAAPAVGFVPFEGLNQETIDQLNDQEVVITAVSLSSMADGNVSSFEKASRKYQSFAQGIRAVESQFLISDGANVTGN